MAKAIERHRLRTGAVPLGAVLAALLAFAPRAAAIDSLLVQTSPDPKATVPMTITATGSTSDDSTLRVFVASASLGCGGITGYAGTDADQLAKRPDATEVISRSPAGANDFNYSAAYTPPAAGFYSVCAWLYRSGPSGTVQSATATGFAVGDAPPQPPSQGGINSGGGGSGSTPVAAGPCIVPRLTGLTYSTARKRIHAAGCIVGKVYRPRARFVSRARKEAAHHTLSVYTQRPRVGTRLAARGKVSLRLTYLPR